MTSYRLILVVALFIGVLFRLLRQPSPYMAVPKSISNERDYLHSQIPNHGSVLKGEEYAKKEDNSQTKENRKQSESIEYIVEEKALDAVWPHFIDWAHDFENDKLPPFIDTFFVRVFAAGGSMESVAVKLKSLPVEKSIRLTGAAYEILGTLSPYDLSKYLRTLPRNDLSRRAGINVLLKCPLESSMIAIWEKELE